MAVKRIVANIQSSCPEQARSFYEDILGMKIVMDHGWILTFASEQSAPVQVSIATDGGSGTALPDLSIEVDNLQEIEERLKVTGITLEYGPVVEPWGVRRFYVRDPFNRLLNILEHI